MSYLPGKHRLILLLVLIFSGYTQLFGITLYSYQTGNWNNVDTWTTDPGGSTLVGSQVPGNGDVVIILSSRTVTLTADVATTGLDINMNSGGILDQGIYRFTSTLSALRGQGTLRLASTSFPTVTINTFVNAGGGLTEYLNTANFSLPSAQATYNNLRINLANNTLTATQLSNITLNGNLDIQTGIYQINDNSANRRQLTILGNVTVSTGSSFTVGTGNTTTTTNPIGISGGTAPFVDYYEQNTHRVVVYGDFINTGTVKFTNQPYPVYNAFPTNGAASVFFMGATDNTLTCNNTTDLYNLIVDKGSDQTFVLSVNSAGYNYFRLFGANTSGGEGGGSNPILKKALWIRNGTFRLYGMVVIPSLSEGNCDGGLSGGPSSEYYIPANGALVIDGPDVVVLTTADSYQEINAAYGTTALNDAQVGVLPTGGCSSFSILGKFQMEDGYISTRESGGFIYWATASGQFIVNGGTLDAKQFRTANSSGGLTAYRQTGGIMTLRGRFQRTVTGVSDVASLKTVPLNTTRATIGINGDVGTFNIDQDANVFEMSGGTIEVLDVCGIDVGSIGRAFEINSMPTYTNVTGGSVIIRPTTGSGTDYPYYFVSAAPIGNFTISQSSGTQPVRLTNITKAGVTARNPSLNVLADITLTGSNATLVSNNYTVEAGGDFTISTATTYTPGTNNTTFDGTGNQAFTGNGTITSGLYKLNVDKPSGTITFTGTPVVYTVRDSLQLFSGTLNDGGKTINVAGHLFIAGTHTGSGGITLNGTVNQVLKFEVFGTPSLGNVTLNNSAGATLLNNGTVNSFTFGTNSILDLRQYRLTVNTTPISGYSSNRYFQTNGIASNGGLSMAVNAASLTSGNSLVFPVGVSGNYTPCTIVGNTSPGTGTGYVAFIPVNSVHPSASGSGQDLDYYWRSIATNMPTGSNVYYQCYDNVAGHWSGGINNAAILIAGSTSWLYGGSAGRPNVILNDDDPNLRGFISADITAGNPGAFNNVDAYYSIGSGSYTSNAIWSNTSHTGPPCNCHPTDASDIIYIGGDAATARNDSVTVTVSFNASSITINGSYTNDNRMPVFNIQTFGGTSTVDVIKGHGKFTTTSATIPASDYGDFINSATAVFNYHGGNISLGTTLTSYPNLLITATSADRLKTLPNANVVVNRNLLLSTNFSGNTLRFNGTGGNLTVYGDIKMRYGSILQLDGASARNLTIYGNMDFRYLNSDDANTLGVNSGTASHQIHFYGDRIIMGQSTISLTNCTMKIFDTTNTEITDRTGGTGSITLNRLVISKDALSDTVTINHPLTLSGATNGSPKSFELQTGRLELNNSNINLNLSSGGASFSIPQTSALVLQGSSAVNVTGSNTGISLDGLLRAEATSQINLGNGTTGDNRYIEYSGSGNAIIELAGSATISVNSQIRRSLLQTSGVLKYRQSGNSSATIYGQGANTSRAKLEIDNAGSEFTMNSGTLTIVRGGGTTYGDLYLRPESGSVTGGTIQLGTQNVGAPQTLLLDANLNLNNLTLDGVGTANTFRLMVNPLALNGNLLINTANSTLDANSLDVSVKGDFTNNGTYIPGTNLTTLNGTAQNLNGITASQFYDLLISPSSSVTLANHITVNRDLTLSSGTFSTGTFNVNIKRNLTNNATHSGNSASGGLLLNGTSNQLISGSGTFGRMELNNTMGARLLNNITLNQDFLLTSGILDINQYLLTLDLNSNIVGSGFGSGKMIISDGVFSNIGIRKYFGTGYATFTYPIGVAGKYTSAELTINENTSSGSIRLNVINDRHPAVTDPNNVLQYYWEVESTGISGFEGNLKLNYSIGDVRGPESNYVAARLVVPPGNAWSKAAPGPLTDKVDETIHTISFDFPAGTSSLGGEYTAGTDAAIPDDVPVYTSNGDGNWDDVNIWTPIAPDGGPNGFIVVIRPGDEISTNGNRRFAYRTTLNGTLLVGTTYGHNFGSVEGSGILVMGGPNLPAGRFMSFFNCSGGTLEYGGNSNYTIIADRIDTVRNLFFTGTGERILPDKDLVICDTLKIDGPSLKNNTYNRKITLFGTIQRLNAGTFNSGTGSDATLVFAGTSAQYLGGSNGNFTGSNALNNLQINNASGLTLQGPVELNGNLLLTEGVITTTSANKLSMLDGNSNITPTGGSSASYVSGPISKRIFGGNDFDFPTGKSTRYGKFTLLGVSDGTWEAEYFNTGYATTAVTSPLTAVSNSEYWHAMGPAGKQAYVQLRWDPLSDVTPMTTENGLTDIRVAEYNTGTASWIEKASIASGDNYNGTAVTTAKMNLDEHDYTLASVTTLKSKASFASTTPVCAGEDLSVVFSKAAASYAFTYSIDGGANVPVNTTSNPHTLTTTTAGRYRITGFTGGVFDTTSVLVRAVPTATLSSDDADNSICEASEIIFTATGGIQYGFYVDGVLVQHGASSTFTTSSLTNGANVYVVATHASGCTDDSPVITITVNPLPVVTIMGATQVCEENTTTLDAGPGFSSYAWSFGATPLGNAQTQDITGQSLDAPVNSVIETYTVVVTSAQGCSGTDTHDITVNRLPDTGPTYHVPNTP